MPQVTSKNMANYKSTPWEKRTLNLLLEQIINVLLNNYFASKLNDKVQINFGGNKKFMPGSQMRSIF